MLSDVKAIQVFIIWRLTNKNVHVVAVEDIFQSTDVYIRRFGPKGA